VLEVLSLDISEITMTLGDLGGREPIYHGNGAAPHA
jgi:hypothetical protein